MTYKVSSGTLSLYSLTHTHCRRDGQNVKLLNGLSYCYLEIAVDNEAAVHVFETEDDFSTVKPNVGLREDAVL